MGCTRNNSCLLHINCMAAQGDNHHFSFFGMEIFLFAAMLIYILKEALYHGYSV